MTSLPDPFDGHTPTDWTYTAKRKRRGQRGEEVDHQTSDYGSDENSGDVDILIISSDSETDTPIDTSKTNLTLNKKTRDVSEGVVTFELLDSDDETTGLKQVITIQPEVRTNHRKKRKKVTNTAPKSNLNSNSGSAKKNKNNSHADIQQKHLLNTLQNRYGQKVVCEPSGNLLNSQIGITNISTSTNQCSLISSMCPTSLKLTQENIVKSYNTSRFQGKPATEPDLVKNNSAGKLCSSGCDDNNSLSFNEILEKEKLQYKDDDSDSVKSTSSKVLFSYIKVEPDDTSDAIVQREYHNNENNSKRVLPKNFAAKQNDVWKAKTIDGNVEHFLNNSKFQYKPVGDEQPSRTTDEIKERASTFTNNIHEISQRGIMNNGLEKTYPTGICNNDIFSFKQIAKREKLQFEDDDSSIMKSEHLLNHIKVESEDNSSSVVPKQNLNQNTSSDFPVELWTDSLNTLEHISGNGYRIPNISGQNVSANPNSIHVVKEEALNDLSCNISKTNNSSSITSSINHNDLSPSKGNNRNLSFKQIIEAEKQRHRMFDSINRSESNGSNCNSGESFRPEVHFPNNNSLNIKKEAMEYEDTFQNESETFLATLGLNRMNKIQCRPQEKIFSSINEYSIKPKLVIMDDPFGSNISNCKHSIPKEKQDFESLDKYHGTSTSVSESFRPELHSEHDKYSSNHIIKNKSKGVRNIVDCSAVAQDASWNIFSFKGTNESETQRYSDVDENSILEVDHSQIQERIVSTQDSQDANRPKEHNEQNFIRSKINEQALEDKPTVGSSCRYDGSESDGTNFSGEVSPLTYSVKELAYSTLSLDNLKANPESKFVNNDGKIKAQDILKESKRPTSKDDLKSDSSMDAHELPNSTSSEFSGVEEVNSEILKLSNNEVVGSIDANVATLDLNEEINEIISQERKTTKEVTGHQSFEYSLFDLIQRTIEESDVDSNVNVVSQNSSRTSGVYDLPFDCLLPREDLHITNEIGAYINPTLAFNVSHLHKTHVDNDINVNIACAKDIEEVQLFSHDTNANKLPNISYTNESDIFAYLDIDKSIIDAIVDKKTKRKKSYPRDRRKKKC